MPQFHAGSGEPSRCGVGGNQYLHRNSADGPAGPPNGSQGPPGKPPRSTGSHRLLRGERADKDRLAALVSKECPQTPGKVIRSPFDPSRDYLIPQVFRLAGKTRPFFKVQDGCDARCSYCIVPTVRGPGRSASPQDILAEVRRIIRLGYQEIVVTGIHLGTYGRKLSQRTSLVELLKRILETPGLGRLRLSSIEPMSFSRGIVELASTYRNFAPHFHIPMQSGSDRILRKMRRPYSALRFLELLQQIRAKIPAAGLGPPIG